MSQSIAQIIIVGLPVEGPFDYKIPPDLAGNTAVGKRVYVPFGNRRLVGVVVKISSKSAFAALKSIFSVLDNVPALDGGMLQLTKEFSRHYGCRWGEAIETALPNALRTKKVLTLSPAPGKETVPASGETILCHDKGTTQRWPFIFEKIKSCLARGQGVIFLTPEITILRKAEELLKKETGFSPSILDKKLSAKKELEHWIAAKEGNAPLVLGTRSAVFAPVKNPGLIIVYEEEHNAYKQEQSPFYHARDAAVMRQEIEGCSLLFVSSAPTAELWYHIKKTKGTVQTFEPQSLSAMQLLDLSNYKPKSRASISFPMRNNIEDVARRGGKTVLFYNRRGFTTKTVCNQCGYVVRCPRCNVFLSYLFSKKKMVCTRCDMTQDLPKICPQCGGQYMRSVGAGVEKLESELARVFPQARVARFDRDTAEVPPEANMIIATQAIMKVIEQVRPDLISVLDIDSELGRYDFRAGQRIFSLLVALRQAAREKLLIQTFQMGSDCLNSALKMDFDGFYDRELRLRKECGFPPFKHLVAVMVRGPAENIVLEQAKILYENLKSRTHENIEILDPQPDMIAKLRDQYRFTIMLTGKPLPAIHRLIKQARQGLSKKKNVIMTVNVDP